MSVNVAIAGATGAVGQEFLTVLAERKFPIKQLRLLASARSAGKTVQFNGEDHRVEELTKDSFNIRIGQRPGVGKSVRVHWMLMR